MIIKKKPCQIVNIGKFLITALFTIIATAALIFQKLITEDEYVEDFIYNLYDAKIVDAKTYDLLNENIGLYIVFLFGILTLIFLIRLIYNVIYTKKMEYVFDFENNSITIEEGIFSKYTDAISLSAIVDIDVTQNFIEMITKRSTVKLYTKGDLTKQSTRGYTKEEKQNIDDINQNIEFGYVGLKKFQSISEPDKLFNKIRSAITVN